MNGFVSLLHFGQPIAVGHTTQHYGGWSDDVARRLAEHRAGREDAITAVAKRHGLPIMIPRCPLSPSPPPS